MNITIKSHTLRRLSEYETLLEVSPFLVSIVLIENRGTACCTEMYVVEWMRELRRSLEIEMFAPSEYRTQLTLDSSLFSFKVLPGRRAEIRFFDSTTRQVQDIIFGDDDLSTFIENIRDSLVSLLVSYNSISNQVRRHHQLLCKALRTFRSRHSDDDRVVDPYLL